MNVLRMRRSAPGGRKPGTPVAPGGSEPAPAPAADSTTQLGVFTGGDADAGATPYADEPPSDRGDAVSAAGIAPTGEDRGYVRGGWLLIVFGLAGFVLWAALAPLDKGVPVPGTVTVAGNRQAVQHPGGGVVDAILVRDGDLVSAGQVLLRMNETEARAQAESLRIQYRTALAAEARLLAERDGATDIVFPEPLRAAAGDAQAAALMDGQRRLLRSRRAVVEGELASMRETLAGWESQLRGLEAARTSKETQRTLLAEQLDKLRSLARQGYFPRLQLIEQERLYAEVDGEVSEDIARIAQLQGQMLELRQRIATRRQEDQRQIGQELSETRMRAESLGHTLRAAEFTLDHAQVKAPAAGTVMGLTAFTPGGTIAAGALLMEIVPEDAPLEIEARLPVHLVDRVHAGLPVELMFTAFNQNRTPRIPATVERVSADRQTDEQTGAPYYRLLARVTDDGKRRLAGLTLRPGMPVEAFVRTGERTLLSYLFKPLTDRAHVALSED